MATITTNTTFDELVAAGVGIEVSGNIIKLTADLLLNAGTTLSKGNSKYIIDTNQKYIRYNGNMSNVSEANLPSIDWGTYGSIIISGNALGSIANQGYATVISCRQIAEYFDVIIQTNDTGGNSYLDMLFRSRVATGSVMAVSKRLRFIRDTTKPISCNLQQPVFNYGGTDLVLGKVDFVSTRPVTGTNTDFWVTFNAGTWEGADLGGVNEIGSTIGEAGINFIRHTDGSDIGTYTNFIFPNNTRAIDFQTFAGKEITIRNPINLLNRDDVRATGQSGSPYEKKRTRKDTR